MSERNKRAVNDLIGFVLTWLQIAAPMALVFAFYAIVRALIQ